MIEEAANIPSSAKEIEFEPVDQCPICANRESAIVFTDAEDYLYSLPGKFRYVRCLQCRVVYENPRPTARDLPKCYKDYHTHAAQSLPDSFLGEWHGASRWIRGGVLAHKYGYRHLAPSKQETVLACALDLIPSVRKPARCYLEKTLPQFAGEGRALEVGTGNGQYAASLKRLGWDVTGIELDAAAATNTAERYGLSIKTGTVEEAQFPSESFDFLSMFHVIEHLPDPVNTLRECYRVLKPDSRIMLRTPNFDGQTRQAFGKYWRGLEAPRHLFIFNAASLTIALEAAGFRSVRTTTIPTATRHYVEASLKIVADHTGGERGGSSAVWLTRLYNLRATAARMFGSIVGDELHVEAIR